MMTFVVLEVDCSILSWAAHLGVDEVHLVEHKGEWNVHIFHLNEKTTQNLFIDFWLIDGEDKEMMVHIGDQRIQNSQLPINDVFNHSSLLGLVNSRH